MRPSKDQYFMEIAQVVASRSTCLRHHVGAVLVRDDQILSTGYNGAPKGLEHCLDTGCAREGVPSGTKHELCKAVHAEQNAIIQAAIHGVRIDGATLYCTHQPCSLCAKMLINGGIERVVYGEDYPDQSAMVMLGLVGVFTVCFMPDEEKEKLRDTIQILRDDKIAENRYRSH